MDQLQATVARRLSAWDYRPLFEGGAPAAGAGPANGAEASSGVPAPPRRAHDDAFYGIKTRLHQKLLGRIDLTAAENLPAEQLRQQLSDLVGRLIDEDALPVNTLERRALITE